MLADLRVVDVVQSIQDVDRQRLQVGGGGVALHLSRVARTRDDGADAGLVEYPPQCQLGGGGPLGVGGHAARRTHPDLERHAAEGLPDVEGRALAVVGAVVLRCESGGLVVFAGQEPAGQRHARDDADTSLQGGRQDLVQRLAPEHIEDELDRGDIGPGDSSQRLFTRLHRNAVGGDTLFGHQRVKSIEDTVLREHQRRRTVQLNEVEYLDAEVCPAAVRPVPEGRQSECLGNVRVRPSAHLRGHRGGGIGPLGQEPPDEDLAAAVTVDVRGVEEGNPCVDRRVQHAHRVSIVDATPVTTQLPTPETDDGYLTTSPTQLTCTHTGEGTDLCPPTQTQRDACDADETGAVRRGSGAAEALVSRACPRSPPSTPSPATSSLTSCVPGTRGSTWPRAVTGGHSFPR